MKNEKAKHTPLPWETCVFKDNMDEWGVHAPEHPEAIKNDKPHPNQMEHAITICRGMTGPSKKENAAFIVHACNAHDDLLAALETIHSILAGAMCNPTLIDRGFLIGIARVAIAKAKGEINL